MKDSPLWGLFLLDLVVERVVLRGEFPINKKII